MNHFTKAFFAVVALIVPQFTFAAATPVELAAKLKAAIDAKDIDAASKLVAWEQAPIPAHRVFKMSVADCFGAQCKVETAEMPEEEKKPQADYQFSVPPEGKLKITQPDGSEGLSMPYGKVNGDYKIILGQQTKEAYAEAKAAADARKIAESLDADLIASGQPLPAGGGEVSSAYRDYLAAIGRKDTAFLAANGTAGDRYFFGNAYKNNPAKAAIALDLARMESISEPTIKGGFLKDNRALLLVSGVNGQGWTTEGAVTLSRNDGKWAVEDKAYSSYPPNQG
jgi:hypothetical protein